MEEKQIHQHAASLPHAGAAEVGCDEQSRTWRTSHLKEYPPSLCKAFAEGVVAHLAEALQGRGIIEGGMTRSDEDEKSEEAFRDFINEISHMQQRFDPYLAEEQQEMRPDCMLHR